MCEIDKLLISLHSFPDYLQCDGMTRVVSYVLTENHITHKVMKGDVSYDDSYIPTHYWIELNDLTIDFTVRKTFRCPNNEQIPHGVFKQTDYPLVNYQGDEDKSIMKMIYRILTDYERI